MNAPRRSYSLDEMEAALNATALLGKVVRTFSPIQGSPFERHEVYLTPEAEEGRYIILSDRMELEGEPGVLVGLYADYETPLGEPEAVDSIAAAVSLAERLADPSTWARTDGTRR